MHDEDYEPILRHWERRAIVGLLGLLITVFGIWAGVVWNGTHELVDQVAAVRGEIVADRLESERYRTLMERRMTILEQRDEVRRGEMERIMKIIDDQRAEKRERAQ